MLDRTPLRSWHPADDRPIVTTVDAHTGGEPFRVVVSGVPEPEGRTMLEKRRHALRHLDRFRTALMWEPRGHADMYGCLLTDPVEPGSDVGVLFLHNEGYSSMCGHGIIALVTVLHETGCLDTSGDAALRIDTPAGTVTATAHREDRRLLGVSFENVPSYVVGRGRTVDVPGLGAVRYDLAFGGAYYAFVEAGPLGLAMEPSGFRALIDAGTAIKQAVAAADPPRHPIEPDLSFLYGTIFVGPSRAAGIDSRHVCVFADGEVDRSPTGTGVSARVALLHASGDMPADRPLRVDSIVGSVFEGSAVLETTVGGLEAVVPSVSGRAWICGHNTWILDPDDPLRDGFFMR